MTSSQKAQSIGFDQISNQYLISRFKSHSKLDFRSVFAHTFVESRSTRQASLNFNIALKKHGSLE